jgi:hypothetical protein
MAYHWREHAKKFTTPHQRHQLIMLREYLRMRHTTKRCMIG